MPTYVTVAGTYDRKDEELQNVAFREPFTQPPVVVLSIQTANEKIGIGYVEKLVTVTARGFTANTVNRPVNEETRYTVHFIAHGRID